MYYTCKMYKDYFNHGTIAHIIVSCFTEATTEGVL